MIGGSGTAIGRWRHQLQVQRLGSNPGPVEDHRSYLQTSRQWETSLKGLSIHLIPHGVRRDPKSPSRRQRTGHVMPSPSPYPGSSSIRRSSSRMREASGSFGRSGDSGALSIFSFVTLYIHRVVIVTILDHARRFLGFAGVEESSGEIPYHQSVIGATLREIFVRTPDRILSRFPLSIGYQLDIRPGASHVGDGP